MAKLDHIDRAIIRSLQKDGRMAVQDLSERVGLSPTPCRRRIRNLEKTGVITGYSALVDPKACGLSLSLYVFIKLERRTRENIRLFEEAIGRMDKVLQCQLITGAYDYLLTMHVPDMSNYEALLRYELADVPAIAEIQTSIVISEVKSKREFAMLD